MNFVIVIVVKNLKYQCYDDNVIACFKCAKKWEVFRLTFLPNSWWEYLDWIKEACTVVNHLTGGRSSLGIQIFLNFIDQFIQEFSDRQEFSLSSDIVEHTNSRFQEELDIILNTIARRNSLRDKVSVFYLGASTSLE